MAVVRLMKCSMAHPDVKMGEFNFSVVLYCGEAAVMAGSADADGTLYYAPVRILPSDDSRDPALSLKTEKDRIWRRQRAAVVISDVDPVYRPLLAPAIESVSLRAPDRANDESRLRPLKQSRTATVAAPTDVAGHEDGGL